MKKLSMMVVSAATCSLVAAVLGAGFDSQSYVQDGLITQFDAVENVGVGQHDSAATVWRDLKGSASIAVPSGTKWIDRAFDAENVDLTAKGMPAFYLDSASTEVAMNAISHPSGYPRLFYHPSADGFYTVHFNGTSSTLQFYINSQSNNRPSATFTSGTLDVATDTTNYRVLVNGVRSSTSGSSVISHTEAPSKDWTINRGDLSAYYRALRHYNRGLTDAEFLANAWVDKVRFFSFQFTGTDTATPVAWASLAWTAPQTSTLTAPTRLTNDVARIIGAKVSVEATDGVALNGLSLEDDATLVVPEGAEICTHVLGVEGKFLARGVYTGADGAAGTKVSWISGAGQVRVSGMNAAKFPTATPNGFGADSYVQDGLVTQLDAIDNVGTGAHDANAAKWIDLAGTATLTLNTNFSWRQGRYFEKAGDGKPIWFGPIPAYMRNSTSCDVPINVHTNAALYGVGGYPRVFAHEDNFTIYFSGSGWTPQIMISGHDERPGLGTFRTGTIGMFSGAANYGGTIDGVVKGVTSAPATNNLYKGSNSWSLGYAGYMLATYGGFRLYNRCLTTDELAWNALVDKFRYFSYRYENMSAEAVAWAEIPWSIPEGQSAAAPAASTNQYAAILGGTVNVAATDDVALLGLSLEKGAKLNVAAGAAVSVKLLYVNGQAMDHDIYVGKDAATDGTVVDWIEGAGQVRVAGAKDRLIPSVLLTPDADGWYTFGLMNGSADQKYIVGERTVWDAYRFRPGEKKLRLQGYVLLETVPDIFSDYDTSRLQYAMVNGTHPYAADRTFEVPGGAHLRYLPGTWAAKGDNCYEVGGNFDSSLMAKCTGDVALATDGRLYTWGDAMPNTVYRGLLTGTGSLRIGSFGRQMRFMGGFALNGNIIGWQYGSGIWLDTLAVTGSLSSVSMPSCSGYETHQWYSSSFIMFGRDGGAETADHAFHIATLKGNASSKVDASGHRWRAGGNLIVWGSNTVHVGTLANSLHAISDRREQDCINGNLDRSFVSKGPGFIAIDNFTGGTIYGSTNVALTVGTVAAGTSFDYTYQSNNVNRLALDITNACAEATAIKATDLAMLPARISGFKGTVTLTGTEERAYEMPIDFTAGPEGLYNTVGCNGSGTLVAAPATGSINVTFPTEGAEPVKGKYALARFTAGGELLNGWTVTLNGESVTEVNVQGHDVTLHRGAKGLWLGVDLPGFGVIVK